MSAAFSNKKQQTLGKGRNWFLVTILYSNVRFSTKANHKKKQDSGPFKGRGWGGEVAVTETIREEVRILLLDEALNPRS